MGCRRSGGPEAGGSLTGETSGRVGAAPTKPCCVGTVNTFVRGSGHRPAGSQRTDRGSARCRSKATRRSPPSSWTAPSRPARHRQGAPSTGDQGLDNPDSPGRTGTLVVSQADHTTTTCGSGSDHALLASSVEDIEHIGSAHDEAEDEMLKSVAQQTLEGRSARTGPRLNQVAAVGCGVADHVDPDGPPGRPVRRSDRGAGAQVVDSRVPRVTGS